MIPTVAQCFQLMDQYRMLENIRDHSVMVARVASHLAMGLNAAGRDISLDTVIAAGLLHDIAKTATLNTDERHDEKGREICLRHEFYEIADIVAEHVILRDGVAGACCAEKEIVYYADKRVKHDKVVSLDERLDYILRRYGRGDATLCRRIEENFRNSRLIEEKIFADLPYRPAAMAGLVNGRPVVINDITL